jgi:hypothetical protein
MELLEIVLYASVGLSTVVSVIAVWLIVRLRRGLN